MLMCADAVRFFFKNILTIWESRVGKFRGKGQKFDLKATAEAGRQKG